MPTGGAGYTFSVTNGVLILTFTTPLPVNGSLGVPLTYTSIGTGSIDLTAIVAGGGERNTTNNRASTSATVLPPVPVPLNQAAWLALFALLLAAGWRRRQQQAR